VQTRWTYLNSDYSLLTNVETILLDGHFVVEHGARSRRGAFFNFNGTAGVWRRTVIDEAGGWQHDTLTEDTDLSYRAQLKGWKFLYLQQVECASELPVDMNGFKSQQARWAKGLMQTAKKILPKVFHAKVPAYVKAGASTCSISSFYLVAQKELRPKTWWRTFLYLPFVMATGIGISVRNAQAVIEALVGKESEFARTPKFSIEGKKGTFAKKSYKNKAGWIAYAEVALGIYFALTVIYAITNENYGTVPFLLLFVWGYLYTGLMSLGQTYFAHLRFGVNAPEMRPAASGAPGF
jgi:cellulose synthase/poly-beta-1,6-N-acetylglucosamine synthase-like glycosyltransferase